VTRVPGIALLLTLAGCAADAAPDRVIRRDSAGVAIVESGAELARAPLPWSIDTVPAVDIGTVAGEEPYQLFRVSGATQLRDGRIVVVNGGTQELRFFDAEGRFLEAVGGRGDGPGEFQFPILVPAHSPDTLWIFDYAGRIALLDTRGALLETIGPQGPIREPVGLLQGRLLSAAGTARAGRDTPEGIMPNDITWELVDPRTGARDTLLQAGGIELFLSNDGNSIAFTPVPFSVAPGLAVAGDRLFMTPGTAPEVRVLDTSGTLQAIHRLLLPPEPVSAGAFDHAVQRVVDQAETEEAAVELRRRHERMSAPETVPEPFITTHCCSSGEDCTVTS